MPTGSNLDAQLSLSIMCTQFIYISLVTGDKQHSPEVTLDKSWLHPVTGQKLLMPWSLSQKRDYGPALPIPTMPGWDNPLQFRRMQHSAEVWEMNAPGQRCVCCKNPVQRSTAPAPLCTSFEIVKENTGAVFLCPGHAKLFFTALG